MYEIMIRSVWKFVFAITAELSWLVPNCVLIRVWESKLQQNEYLRDFNDGLINCLWNVSQIPLTLTHANGKLPFLGLPGDDVTIIGMYFGDSIIIWKAKKQNRTEGNNKIWINTWMFKINKQNSSVNGAANMCSLYYNICRADSRFAPSQWEMALLCNDVSHWLGTSLESALHMHTVLLCFILLFLHWHILNPLFHIKTILAGMSIPILQIRWFWDQDQTIISLLWETIYW